MLIVKLEELLISLKAIPIVKNFPQYDICDYIYLAPSFQTFCKLEIANWKEKQIYLAGTSWYKEEPCPTYEQLKKDYDKYYRRK